MQVKQLAHLRSETMQIQNKDLHKLDKRVAEFYKLNQNFFNANANLYGKELYHKEIKRLENEANKIKPKNEFDKLILENIKSIIKINNHCINFITDPKYEYSVNEFLDLIIGKGSWKFIENQVKNKDYKMRWELTEQNREINSKIVNRFTEEAQKLAKEYIPKLKSDTLNYGVKNNYLPKDFDFNIFLLPPKDGREYSSWRPETKILNLGSYTFYFIFEDKKTKIKPMKAYSTIFHELLGHGAHQIYSKDMPESIKFTEEIGTITATKPITEGIATYRENEGIDYLEKNAKELGITKLDLKDVKENNLADYDNRISDIFYGLTKEKELRESKFDSQKEVMRITNNYVLSKWFKNEYKKGFLDIWGQLGYVFGLVHYNNMLNEIKKDFGSKYFEENKNNINIAAMKGVWSWEVYPKAVKYFLENDK